MRINSSNKFFDGLSAGKPVLVNFGGWIHDLVQKNECGISTWQMSTQDASKLLDHTIHNTTFYPSTQLIQDIYPHIFDRDLLFQKFLHVFRNASSELKADLNSP